MTVAEKLGRALKWTVIAAGLGAIALMLPAACEQLRSETASNNVEDNSVGSASNTVATEVATDNNISSSNANTTTESDTAQAKANEGTELTRVWAVIKKVGDACDTGNDPRPALLAWQSGQGTREEAYAAVLKSVEACRTAAITIGNTQIHDSISSSFKSEINEAKADCAIAYTTQEALRRASLMMFDGGHLDEDKIDSLKTMSTSNLNVCIQRFLGMAASHDVTLDTSDAG